MSGKTEVKEMDDLWPIKLYRKKPVVVRCVRMITPFTVKTLEGEMSGKAGDWLIEGVNKELYPCDAEIFRKTYEEAE